MPSKTVAGGAESTLASALAGWVRMGMGVLGGVWRSHMPGICGIKMFVWCWGVNKTAVVRAPVQTGQFGNFKLLYPSGFSPCIIQFQITRYCCYEGFDLGTRKVRGLMSLAAFLGKSPVVRLSWDPTRLNHRFCPFSSSSSLAAII